MNPTNSLPAQNPGLQNAMALHQSGRLAEAAAQYKQLLNISPQDPMLLSGLGAVTLQMGSIEEGIGLLGKSLEAEPNQPVAFFNLGVAYTQKKQYHKALASYDRALAIQPNNSLVHVNRGAILERFNRTGEALASYDRAIAIKPDDFLAHFKRGVLLEKFNRQGDTLGEVLACYERAIAIKPDYPVAHFKRGQLLEKFGRIEEALASYDRAIDHPPVHIPRGVLLQNAQRNVEALQSYDRALALNPNDAVAHVNRGVLLQNFLRLDEALQSYDRAIAAKPDYAEAYWFKALVKLLLGDYEQGWLLHEWRWKSMGYQYLTRNFNQPLWLGEQPINGKTLLIHAEVGLGDSVQFCRYVPMVEAMGAKIILELPAALLSLVATLEGNFTLIEKGQPLPEFDLHCPAMSLPLVFKTTLKTVPATVPYLHADPEKQKIWQQRLGNKDKPRIGLVWSGLVRGNIDSNPAKKRSIPLRMLEPLLRLPIEFHSLQKNYLPEDSAALSQFSQIHKHQDELHDFSDTAALIKEMDMVISIDTSVAHLVGALGHPVWILLPQVTDYRWTLDGAATPWYPSATLFRQSATGDWTEVIAEVAQRLAATIP